MFKDGQVFILTHVENAEHWINKRMIYSSTCYHILIDNVDEHFTIGKLAFFNTTHLKKYKAKLYVKKKNHLPNWW